METVDLEVLVQNNIQLGAGILPPRYIGDNMEKILMSLKEVCEYTGWGETKVREILKRPESTFTITLGNRLFVNKNKFDDYLNRCAKYHIPI